jgi:hypothetical protein
MIKQLMKKQPRQPEASAEVSLADRIRAARAEAEAFIDLKTGELKASPEGQLLPVGVLRQTITRHSRCACAVALSILDAEKKP